MAIALMQWFRLMNTEHTVCCKTAPVELVWGLERGVGVGVGVGVGEMSSLLAARGFCRGSVLPYLRNTDTQARPSSFALLLAALTIFDENSPDITS